MSRAVPLAVSVTRVIEASPEVVYDLVSDVTRMGDYSPENTGAAWLDGAAGPAVGARFKGTNRLGSNSWSTKPTITAADRGRRFEFVVPGARGATWTYTFDPVAGGVTESMRQDRPSIFLVRFLQRRAGVTDRAANLHASMTTTLERVAAVAERQPVSS
jgi:Polyketide cyclase / dehydrase and lipid transport